ncbi:hypothetical protein KP509_18G064200 [Ceratopteris richardii]|uniref:Tify domain-containing protein n=1 Tax=Ceratopteris richardii TaxID=49495 RepID=A0A8T2SUW5_CERRI|nr:hypothetical protein KP509_18G064200 [Ceratopteris richardii]
MASRANQQKTSFFSEESSDKGLALDSGLISFQQPSLSPPAVALSLLTRERCALALKHIFDRIYSPTERESNNNDNKGIASIKDRKRRDYIEVEADCQDKSNRAFQGCTDQENGPAWRVSSSRELLSGQTNLHQAVKRIRPTSPALGEQRTAQLTLFYAGTVNIYDDVPADKAKAIMLLAGTGNPLLVSHSNEDERQALGVKENSPSATSMYMNKSSTVMKDPEKTNGEQVNTGKKSRLNSTATTDVESITPTAMSSKRLLLTTETRSQHAAKEPQIGLPHARKASLARFMERRKTGCNSNSIMRQLH